LSIKDCYLIDFPKISDRRGNLTFIVAEKVFRHDENHLYLTPMQAKALAEALTRAVENSEKNK